MSWRLTINRSLSLSWFQSAGILQVGLGILIGIFIICFVAWSGWFYQPAPSLSLSSNVLVIEGSGSGDQTLVGKTYLTNSGNAPLEFDTTASCTCTSLSPRSGVIEPQDTVAISVGVRLNLNERSQQNATVTVSTNDPDMPSVNLIVVAKAKRSFEVLPTAVSFRQNAEGLLKPITRKLTIQSLDHNFKLTPGTLKFHFPGDWLDVNPIFDENGTVALTLMLRDPAPRSSRTARLRIYSAHDRLEQILVPITLEVVEKIVVVPETLSVRYNLSEGELDPVVVILKSSRPGVDFEGVKISPDCNGVLIQDAKITGASQCVLTLKVSSKRLQEGESVDVPILVAGQNFPVVVAIRRELYRDL